MTCTARAERRGWKRQSRYEEASGECCERNSAARAICTVQLSRACSAATAASTKALGSATDPADETWRSRRTQQRARCTR